VVHHFALLSFLEVTPAYCRVSIHSRRHYADAAKNPRTTPLRQLCADFDSHEQNLFEQ
jgi:hypothetical protein